MISARELRIGNHIEEGKIWYLETDEDGSYFYKADSFGSIATPIPLTEEWLLKFGFERCENKGFVYTDDRTGESTKTDDRPYWFIEYVVNNNRMRFCWYENDKTANFGPCKYVHQIQNMYFALTGEELTLKETE